MFMFHVAADIISRCTLNYVRDGVPSVGGSPSSLHGAFSRCVWKNGLQIWTVAANVWNKQSRTADRGWFSSLGFSEVLTTPRSQNLRCYETFHITSDSVWSLGTTQVGAMTHVVWLRTGTDGQRL
jgi:hypothetical protein